jgi:hypothetical protein
MNKLGEFFCNIIHYYFLNNTKLKADVEGRPIIPSSQDIIQRQAWAKFLQFTSAKFGIDKKRASRVG